MAETEHLEGFDGPALQQILELVDNDIPKAIFKGSSLLNTVETTDIATRELLLDLSRSMPSGPPVKVQRLVNILYDMEELHKHPKGLRYGQLIGMERLKEGLCDRLQDYLTIRVLSSRRVNTATGEVLIDTETNKEIYMMLSTLSKIASDCINLLEIIPLPRMTEDEKAEARKTIWSHVDVLTTVYNLKPSPRHRTTLYPADILGLIEFTLERADNHWDIAVQFCCLLPTFFYTGARVGSVLSTVYKKLEYLTWGDIRFRPVRNTIKKIVGYDVIIEIRSWKGYSKDQLRIKFHIKSTSKGRNANFDLGAFLLAHGVRQQVFGDKTVDFLMQNDRFELKCDPSRDNDPVFVALRSRIGLSQTALTGDQGTRQLRSAMQAYGIASGEPGGSDTFYCLRRRFLTDVARKFGPRIAKFYAGHTANSTCFERYYDLSDIEDDILNALLEDEGETYMILTPWMRIRASGHLNESKVTLKSALERCPEFRHVLAKRDLLQNCLRSGSNLWLKVEPWNGFSSRAEPRQLLPSLITVYSNRLRQLISILKQQDTESTLELQRMARDEMDYGQIQAQVHNANGPSQLAVELQRRLIEQELKLCSTKRIDITESVSSTQGATIVCVAPTGNVDDEEEEAVLHAIDSAEEGMNAQDQYKASEGGKGKGKGVEDEDGEEAEAMWGSKKEKEGGHAVRVATSEEYKRIEELSMSGLQSGKGSETKKGEVDRVLYGMIDEDPEKLSESMSIFRALVELSDPSKGGVLCQACQRDSTASSEQKITRYTAMSRLDKHLLQFHNPHAYGLRWLKSNIDPQSRRWHCPYGAGEGGSEKAKTTKNTKLCGISYAASSVEKSAPKHLLEAHQYALTEDLRKFMDPKTRATLRAQAQEAQEEELGHSRKTKSRWTNPGPNFHDFLLIGTFQPEDRMDPYVGDLGLGPSLKDDDIDMDTDLLPDSFYDDKGDFNI
nr:uncharacterized protein I203_01782 [Kwoniella mangroviensis CBS 8507]OCF68400.1 hypothetical protein I203_01782 [Kwoniella mangroviensis CBS 8507]